MTNLNQESEKAGRYGESAGNDGLDPVETSPKGAKNIVEVVHKDEEEPNDNLSKISFKIGGEDLQQQENNISERAAEYATDGMDKQQQRISDHAAEYAIDAKGKQTQRISDRAAEYAMDSKSVAAALRNTTTTGAYDNNVGIEGIQPLPAAALHRNQRRRPEAVPGAHRLGRDPDLPPEDEENQLTVASEEGERRPGVRDEDLARAQPVAEDGGDRGEAQPLDTEQKAAEQAAREAKERQLKQLGFAAIVFSLIVLIIALIADKSKPVDETIILSNTTDNPTLSPTSSPTIAPPPINNLEELYWSLPEFTQQQLYDEYSYQWQAWDWLMAHPNITNLPEWRKMQLFAMVTFFYSFAGPNWPVEYSQGWLNYTTNECSWINTDQRFLTGISIQFTKTRSYDFAPCNEAGELQTLFLMRMELASYFPSMPAEVSLLSSLQIIGCMWCGLDVPLSTILTEEVTQLESLKFVALHENKLHGTVPKEIGRTSLMRNLAISKNALTGTIPTELVGLTYLQQIHAGGNQFTGAIPSTLGLMTQLTDLKLWTNLLTGTIPSELGLLTNLRGGLTIYGNSLEGTIPSQLGGMSKVGWLSLWGMSLTGSIPTQIGLMTRLKDIELHVNSLSGAIPSELGLLPRVELLGMSHNSLTGPIPSQMGLLNTTTILLLGNNSLSGPIPTELWQLSGVQRLHLSLLPHISGSIPEEMCLLGTNQDCSFDVDIHFKDADPCPSLAFDCTKKLCGCGCTCPGFEDANQTEVLDGNKM